MEKLRNLWVYGDSFAVPPVTMGCTPEEKQFLETNNWWSIVAKHFHAVESPDIERRNFALEATGLDYTYRKVEETNTHWQKDDIVIVVLTSSNRAWLYEDKPTLSNMHIIEMMLKHGSVKDEFTAKEKEHMAYYFTHFHHKKQKEVIQRMFLKTLSLLKSQRGLKALVVLEAFKMTDRGPLLDNLISSVRNSPSLWEISTKELLEPDPKKRFFLNTRPDSRTNHLTWENHKILADKIIHAIDNNLLGEFIDLREGFLSKHWIPVLGIKRP